MMVSVVTHMRHYYEVGVCLLFKKMYSFRGHRGNEKGKREKFIYAALS